MELTVTPTKCPKCYGFIPNNETPGAYPGAISRRDNKTEICSACGSKEAIEDFLGMETCPDCWSVISETNPAIEERYSPERYGHCQDCYDPTPMERWEVTE
jgi:hypothetical protein